MPAFPARLTCHPGRSRSFPDRPVTRGKALLMRLGLAALRGSNPRSSAVTSSSARALRPGGLLVPAFRGRCVATAAIRPPITSSANLASVTERHPQMHAHAVMGGRHRTTKRFVVSAPGAWFWPRARTLITERGQPSGGNRARSRRYARQLPHGGSARDPRRTGRSARTKSTANARVVARRTGRSARGHARDVDGWPRGSRPRGQPADGRSDSLLSGSYG